MTALDCCVANCKYNAENYCSRNEIDVKGTSANTSDDTCCGSFKDQGFESSNSTKDPNPTLSVSCEATNCIFNESKLCSAEHIDIAGFGANESSQTLCSSFVDR